MVDRRRVGSELREEFSVLGSTGNVRSFDIYYTALGLTRTPGVHSGYR